VRDPRPALVIGYGNSLRGDDAAGPLAAAAVRDWNLPDVIVLSVTQLTPELAEPLSGARLAIFIDARLAIEPDSPEAEVCALEPFDETPAFAHVAHPGHLLALARTVYGCWPPAWLVTIRAADLRLGEGLSSGAARGLDAALVQIAALLR
jgi:hydrogenase maturation protease